MEIIRDISAVKKLLVVVIIAIILYPAAVLSHPGGTDRHGGHKCRKDCADWHLDAGEYHLHDENGNPIRLGKQETGDIPQQTEPAGERTLAPAGTTEIEKPETSAGINGQIPQNAQEIKYDSIQRSDTLIAFPNLLLLLMLIALLLLLIILKRKKEKQV
ncbi:MAG: hypothetical protein A2077_05880 [Nitrospirae bacterium GWC2_46_6]|nr:MAG: hypothetical protein A2Z82_03905 [Nitrospirae bacterium GWA2_46_11]OGW21282.1 MAG: hypothetical protein A2077_05880 [Nitrospirae bacterium GWC2_46_6]OGW23423.1 MAG: hypothetical protein A2X55_01190 [Nitrospirae bacterium GWB2_47_37]HAK88994.1 hypothetical protein [Nitrospiraceae bacterium]HCZ12277.1 hypothetical protein [Nitrospiraceae bacterium]